MRIENADSVLSIEENSYVTPFRTKADKLFFIVSPGSSPAEAYRDCACFEGMTGLDSLAQPRLYENFANEVIYCAEMDSIDSDWDDPQCPDEEGSGQPNLVAAILASRETRLIRVS